MKKKIPALLLAIVAALSCIAFTACDKGEKNNYSETYRGTLSSEAYATADDAAQAFVANEISSEATPATFEIYSKGKDLSENEIAKLNLTEDEISDVKNAESGRVSYIKETASVYGAAPAPSYYKSQTVYIIEFNTPSSGGAFKYFVPLPANGESVTKSYLESVLNAEDYKNCTSTYEMPIKIKLSDRMIGMTIEMSAKYVVRITPTAVEMVMTLRLPAFADKGLYYETQTTTSYLINSPEGILQATSNEDIWEVSNFTDEYGIEKLSDLYSLNLPDADYSYFIKTKTGFKMSNEYLDSLMNEMLEEADIYEYLGNDFSSTISADYYVAQGLLDSAQVVLKMNGTLEGVKTSITIKAVNKYSDFGTTAVTIPDSAKLVLGID